MASMHLCLALRMNIPLEILLGNEEQIRFQILALDTADMSMLLFNTV
ncbi:hypothetical protein SP38_216 [Salmonella phage 38]|uniref:Uncharacterized protein n=1 Tax=Salmonella phage 38 TaxID=1654891 RepID=A0A0N7CFT6_9CAUD|nr:hypothetical protein SP38_216 [Salmonella phage 38]AKJ73818.1 hypothetical protein SP38_216 [Salmonella phage 38]